MFIIMHIFPGGVSEHVGKQQGFPAREGERQASTTR
jgi:hypothetical protein